MLIEYYNDNWLIISQLDRGSKAFFQESFAELLENYVMLPRYSSLGKSSCYVRVYVDLGDFILLPHNLLPHLLVTSKFQITISPTYSRFLDTKYRQLATHVLDTLKIEVKSKQHNLRLTEEWLEGKGIAIPEGDTHTPDTDKTTRMYQSQKVATGSCRTERLIDISYSEFKEILEANRDKIETILPGVKLREFQTDAVISFLTHSVGGLPFTTGIVKAPARSGKTEVICAIAKIIGKPTLVLTDRKQLIRQIKERMLLRKLDDKIGYVDGSENTVENITVSTVQSVEKNPQLLRDPYLVVIDEVHTISNKRFTADFDQIGLTRDINDNEGFLLNSTAPVCLGTSATPFGYDEVSNLTVRAGCGSIAYEIKRKKLEDLGILARSRVLIFDLKHTKCNKPYAPDKTTAQELYLHHYAYNKTRNELASFAMRLANKEGGKHLLLVANKKHVEELLKTFPDALVVFGSETETYTDDETGKKRTRTIASMKVRERESVIKKFVESEHAILIATSVVFTGIDFPGGMDSVINLAAGSSFESTIQRICRGLNPNKEDKVVNLYDFYDNGRGFSKLEKKAKLREEAYRLEGFEVSRVNIPEKFFTQGR